MRRLALGTHHFQTSTAKVWTRWRTTYVPSDRDGSWEPLGVSLDLSTRTRALGHQAVRSTVSVGPELF